MANFNVASFSALSVVGRYRPHVLKHVTARLGEPGYACGRWFCLLALLAGCGGPDVAVVQGQVTLDGQPLTGASIVFEVATRGISVNVPLADDGSYNARTFDKRGLPPGEYAVAIRPGVVGDGSAPLVGEENSIAATANVPQHYRSVKTSGLTASVALGDNGPFDFALTTAR